MRRAQQVEKHLDRGERQWTIMYERIGFHPRIVAAVIVMMGMPGMVVVMAVIMVVRQRLFAQPATDVSALAVGIVEPALK